MANIRSCRHLIVLLLVAACGVAQADSDLSTHLHGDCLVFDKFGDNGQRELMVVPLRDEAQLKVTGRGRMVPVPYIDAYDSQGTWLIALYRDRVFVYDVRDTGAPALATEFHLKNQGQQPGYSQIVRIDGRRFVLLSAVSTAELQAEGDDPHNWNTVDQERTPALRAKAGSQPVDSAFERSKDISDHPEPMVLKETARFRYQLAWQTRRGEAEIVHTKVVQKINKASGRVVSELALGSETETID